MPSRAPGFAASLLILLSAAWGLGSSALAQTPNTSATADQGTSNSDNGGLAEVIVRAQRRAENLQNVPINIQALDSNLLQTSQTQDTMALPVLTPGLVIGVDAGYVNPLFLRGVGTTAEGPGIESPIATYVDGVYYGALVGAILSLTSIDQIEIDKGPQGTLFGRNATGGLIQVTTKDPSRDFGGFANVTGGNYSTWGAEGYLTGPVSSSLATNLAVYFRDQMDGFGTNLGTGLDVDKYRNLVVRNKWLLASSDTTQLKLTLDYEQDNYVMAEGAAPGTIPLGGQPPYPNVAPHDIAGFYQPYGMTHLGGVSFQLHHDFGFGQFVSITAYRYTSNDVQGEPQFTLNPDFAVSADVPERHDQYTQEFQFLAPSDSRIQWTAGLYLLYSNNRFAYPGVWVTGGLVAPLEALSFVSQTKIYSIAPYGQMTMQVLPATNLTLGFRYSGEKHDFNVSNTYTFPPGGGPPAVSEGADSERFEKPTWRIALDHHFTPDLMGYVSYNRGFKSGGFNDTTIPVISYLPETIDEYELGSKWNLLDNRLRFNWSAFLYDYKNMQQISYALSSAQPIIYNGAAARGYGLDLDVDWKISRGLSVIGSMEYLHAKFTNFPNAVISTPVPGGGNSFTEGSAEGNQLPYAPTWTFSLSPEYVIPMSGRGELILSATYNYNDGYFAAPDNRLRQPAYNWVNAQIAWNSPRNAWNVRVWGKNLTDAEVTAFMSAGATGDEAAYQPPRTYGVTIVRNF